MLNKALCILGLFAVMGGLSVKAQTCIWDYEYSELTLTTPTPTFDVPDGVTCGGAAYGPFVPWNASVANTSLCYNPYDCNEEAWDTVYTINSDSASGSYAFCALGYWILAEISTDTDCTISGDEICGESYVYEFSGITILNVPQLGLVHNFSKVGCPAAMQEVDWLRDL